MLILGFGCSTPQVKKPLTVSEQNRVDTKNAEGLAGEFKDQVHFYSNPKAEIFIQAMAHSLLKQKPEFENETIELKIHDDTKLSLQHFFGFPGIMISVPQSFLRKVEFENELAAAVAFEIANVMNRFLAEKVEAQRLAGNEVHFGDLSVFRLNRQERLSSIKLATELMYGAGFDTRGMASIFKRYPRYYVQETATALFQKEVDFNIREAQRAKSEFLPQMKPIVRSGEFIQFKKDLSKRHP
jgi:predicted Zn-dependent protease